MKCKDCCDFHNGMCTCIGEENCAFPVTPESECVLDSEIDSMEQEPAEEIRMPFPGMKWEDIERRWADETGAYLLLKDGSLLHSADGTNWALATPGAIR